MTGNNADFTRPVIERPDGTWRAIEKGVPVQPSQVRLSSPSAPTSEAETSGFPVFHQSFQGLHAIRAGSHAYRGEFLRARRAEPTRHEHVCESQFNPLRTIVKKHD